jgi:hypothetical protein
LAGRPSSVAAAPATRSASATPPGAQTFEILLLMMIAPRVGSARRARPTRIGAPGKALRVKTAAKSAGRPVEREQRQRHPRRLAVPRAA